MQSNQYTYVLDPVIFFNAAMHRNLHYSKTTGVLSAMDVLKPVACT